MIKIYVIDTNVLLDAPYALESFEDNAVILPMVVLEELDHFKKAEGEIGVNARKVIRYLDQQRQKGDLTEGVVLESGGTLRVEKNFVDVQLPEDLPVERMDNRILKVCIGLTETREEQVILVTKDILLRIKAQILGIEAENFTTDQVSEHENQYTADAKSMCRKRFLRILRKRESLRIRCIFSKKTERIRFRNWKRISL